MGIAELSTNETELTRSVIEVASKIESDTESREALKMLVREGCDADVVVRGLYAYCCLKAEDIERGRKAMSHQQVRVAKLATKLAELSNEVRWANEVVQEHGIVCHFAPDTDRLLAYSDFLQDFSSKTIKRIASKRFDGRGLFLSFVSQSVRQTTNKPHFRELLTLIERLQKIYRPNSEQVEEEALEKRIQRSARLEQDEMEAIRNMLVRECGQNQADDKGDAK